MAELKDILASGNIPLIDAQEINEGGANLLALIDLINTLLADGIHVPEIDGAGAEPNSIFFNTDNSRVCWKAHGGTVLRFQLTL
jgi:hypothetical protein